MPIIKWENIPDEIQKQIEKLPRRMTRREFIKNLPLLIKIAGSAYLSYIAAYFGIQILDYVEDSNKRKIDPLVIPTDEIEVSKKPPLKENLMEVINEVNLLAKSEDNGDENPVIKIKFDDITQVIIQERRKAKSSDFEIKSILANKEIDYIRTIINDSLNSVVIPRSVNSIDELKEFLKTNNFYFKPIKGIDEFKQELGEVNNQKYAYIIISNGKPQIIYGIKSILYQGYLPVSTNPTGENAVSLVNFDELNTSNLIIYKVTI